jgi:hypothetical protein
MRRITIRLAVEHDRASMFFAVSGHFTAESTFEASVSRRACRRLRIGEFFL